MALGSAVLGMAQLTLRDDIAADRCRSRFLSVATGRRF
jgi:hypothetical protein